MARGLRKFTDDWIAAQPYRGEDDKKDVVLPDPELSRHRLVISRTRKIFEIQAERPRRYGSRRTYVLQTGRAPMTKLADARAAAVAFLAQVDAGLDPNIDEQQAKTTLGAGWDAFRQSLERRRASPRTIQEYEGAFRRCLGQWRETPLETLAAQPRLARDEHDRITRVRGPVEANHAMRLLRAVHRHAAKGNLSLSRERHPCIAVEWNPEEPAQRAIPFDVFPCWSVQADEVRNQNPVRAAFHRLCLFTGMRPGELQRAEWKDLNLKRRVLVLHKTKTGVSIEIPLTLQIVRELRRARDAGRVLYPTSPFVFPGHSKSGHLVNYNEKRSVLSHWGNSGRHTHKTIATALEIDELFADMLQGRSIKKAGVAGRGYIGRSALGGTLRDAQKRINREIDRLIEAGKPPVAQTARNTF